MTVVRGGAAAPRVVIAIDSFKGSVSSLDCGRAALAGVRRAVPSARVVVVPVADGGEGTVEALVAGGAGGGSGGTLVPVAAHDAVGRPLGADTGCYVREGRRVAVVEAARTIGLDKVVVEGGLPARANSRGLGEHLRAASRDADEVIVTLGGSATTDGGTGLFAALGARFLDRDGVEIPPTENPLWRFVDADLSGVRVPEVVLTALCDVINPLTGPDGAASVFGPQKGAGPDAVRHLDERMAVWAGLLEGWAGRAVADVPGAGAAGGLGAALLALGARLEPGFDRVAAETGLADVLAGADLVISGEGSVDAQTARGKVPSGVARLARRVAPGARVVLLAGRVEDSLGELEDLVDAVLPIHRTPMSVAEAMDPVTTRRGIAATAFQVARLALRRTGWATRDR